jgi:hypothetical protein
MKKAARRRLFCGSREFTSWKRWQQQQRRQQHRRRRQVQRQQVRRKQRLVQKPLQLVRMHQRLEQVLVQVLVQQQVLEQVLALLPSCRRQRGQWRRQRRPEREIYSFFTILDDLRKQFSVIAKKKLESKIQACSDWAKDSSSFAQL